MKIIRFKDADNNIFTGKLLTNTTAELLNGSIEQGFLPTGITKKIETLLAPVVPPNIFAIGFNYLDHITETESLKPAYPVLFMKATSSITSHNSFIVLPKCETRGPETDFEGELAVIIGKNIKQADTKTALNGVFGYTCANDVSARRWQKHGGGGQWIRAKSFDTFCPLGPHIVTADEIDNPQKLSIKTTLNGELMQNSNTDKMIFSIAQIISYISQDTTLLPGTVILTGTPDGVGFTRNPRLFLKANDIVKISIEKIGSLSNRVLPAK